MIGEVEKGWNDWGGGRKGEMIRGVEKRGKWLEKWKKGEMIGEVKKRGEMIGEVEKERKEKCGVKDTRKLFM